MDNSDAGEQAQRIYLVEVQQRGNPVASYTIEAPNALAAINQVELLYKEPPALEETENKEERRSLFSLMRHWHGYMFQARAL